MKISYESRASSYGQPDRCLLEARSSKLVAQMVHK
jgi:hypothetical protein